MKKHIVSQSGLQKIKDELKELKTVKMKEVLAQLAQAKSYGDFSENVEYSEMKSQKRQLDTRIRKLENIIKNAVIADDDCQNNDSVAVGCKVSFKNLKDDTKKEYQIVGAVESDPLNGKISNESPIGKAFLNKKVGDEVIVETPSGVNRYEVISIS
jgi:transcription elongation factor GreA